MPRPSKFCPNNAAAIVAAVYLGSTVEAACRRARVKRTTFIGWSHKQGFTAVLDRSKAAGRMANLRLADDKVAAVEVRQITVGQPPELAQPVTPMPVREYPEIRGACLWSANDAALAVIVDIIGNAMDSLRADLRSRGFNV